MQETSVKKVVQPSADCLKFKAFLMSVPSGDSREMTRKIIDGCKIPYHTFMNWKQGLCRIPELHKAKIEEIAGRKIF